MAVRDTSGQTTISTWRTATSWSVRVPTYSDASYDPADRRSGSLTLAVQHLCVLAARHLRCVDGRVRLADARGAEERAHHLHRERQRAEPRPDQPAPDPMSRSSTRRDGPRPEQPRTWAGL